MRRIAGLGLRLGLGLALWFGAIGATAQTSPTPHAPPSLDIYGQLPGIEAFEISGTGDRMALIGVVGDKRRLLVMTAAGAPLLSSDVGSLKIRDLDWAGDRFLVVSTSQTIKLDNDPYELFSATVIDVDGKNSHEVFRRNMHKEPYVSSFYGYRQIDGQWYGYFGDLFSGALTRVNLKSDAEATLSTSSAFSQNWALGVDGKIAATSHYDNKRGDWFLLIDSRHLLEQKSLLHQVGLAGLGTTPDKVLVSDTNGNRISLTEVSTGPDAKIEPLWPELSIEHLVRARSGLLLGAKLEGGADAAFADPMLTARYAAAKNAFPGYQFHLMSHTDDLKRMIVMTDGKDDSGTYWLVDITTGAAKIMGSAYPGVHARDVGPTSLYHYKAADGLELDGVLTLPPGPARKSLPVIVMPHGGPIGARDSVGFDWWAQAFASRGYAVFQPNYRGSSGHGLAFERAGYKEWGRKMLSDMADGLHALAAAGTIDPKRACIIGASYGGYAAMAGVTVQQGLYRCAVSLAGVSDLSEMIRWERENWGVLNASMRYERTALGIGEADAPKLEDISPARLAAKADAPLLLIHGADDTVVDIEQSRRMATALKAAGKPYEYMELKGDDHWLSKGETRSAMLKAAVAFVEKQNPAN